MTQTHQFVSVTLDTDPDFLITLHQIPDNPDRRLLITFGPAGSGIAPHGFATAYARRKGIDTIYVAQRADTYYQALTRTARSAAYPARQGTVDEPAAVHAGFLRSL